jgi:NH3-dependent NAD+ synthetase
MDQFYLSLTTNQFKDTQIQWIRKQVEKGFSKGVLGLSGGETVFL